MKTKKDGRKGRPTEDKNIRYHVLFKLSFLTGNLIQATGVSNFTAVFSPAYATRDVPYLSIQHVHTQIQRSIERQFMFIYVTFNNEPTTSKSGPCADIHPHFPPAYIPTHHVTLLFDHHLLQLFGHF